MNSPQGKKCSAAQEPGPIAAAAPKHSPPPQLNPTTVWTHLAESNPFENGGFMLRLSSEIGPEATGSCKPRALRPKVVLCRQRLGPPLGCLRPDSVSRQGPVGQKGRQLQRGGFPTLGVLVGVLMIRESCYLGAYFRGPLFSLTLMYRIQAGRPLGPFLLFA